MRRIRKRTEPRSWKQYRLSTPGARYEDAPKDDLRRALLAEQGYLCCYCMGRIDEDTTRIEHHLSRQDHLSEQFSYRNLLAACTGGEGLEDELQHCDVRKRNAEITLDPANPERDVEQFIRYSSSGKIEADDDDVRRDVDVTLNLNLYWLKEGRMEALAGFLEGFERKHANAWTPGSMERELKKWEGIPSGGRLTPYAGVVVSYLRKRLRRAR